MHSFRKNVIRNLFILSRVRRVGCLAVMSVVTAALAACASSRAPLPAPASPIDLWPLLNWVGEFTRPEVSEVLGEWSRSG